MTDRATCWFRSRALPVLEGMLCFGRHFLIAYTSVDSHSFLTHHITCGVNVSLIVRTRPLFVTRFAFTGIERRLSGQEAEEGRQGRRP